MNPRPKLFIFIYGITWFCSLFVFIPMVINAKDFQGYCLLNAQGNFTYDTHINKTTFVLEEWGRSSDCSYTLFMGVVLLIVGTGLVCNYGILVWKEHDKPPFGSFLILVGNGLITFCTFLAAIIVTAGFDNFCSGTYELAQSTQCNKVDLSYLDKNFNVYSSRFFSNVHAVEFGLWLSVCTWIVATVFAFFKVYYYHKNDDLLQSLAHEKETLLNRRRRNEYEQIHSTPTA